MITMLHPLQDQLIDKESNPETGSKLLIIQAQEIMIIVVIFSIKCMEK